MLSALNSAQSILAFGDSLTFGYGAEKNMSYPAQLSRLINREVINEGINGELSYQGLLRLESLLDKHQPKLLLLCHGANDLLQNLQRDKMAENLRAMIELARYREIQVVLIAVPDSSLSLAPVKQYQDIAKQMDTVIEKQLLADVLSQPDLHVDPIHPNQFGYQVIAERIAQLLICHGAIHA